MPNEALLKFAEELKKTRESKKITLQQIANKTKIDIKFLQAIEESKFDIMPDLYIRAFIKEYAQTIDLNPEETIKKFDLSQQGKTEEKIPPDEKKEIKEEPAKEKPTSSEQSISDEQPNQPQKKINKKYLNYNVAIAAGLVVLILAYFLFFKESSHEIIVDQQNNGSTDGSPAYEIDTAKTATNSVPMNDSLQLSVNTLKRVWVKVIADNNVRSEGMVDANNRSTYRASNDFRVVIGNAGSVQLALNGKPIKAEIVGKQGEIRNLVINADTVKAYTIIIPAKNENQSPKTN